jgi:hypothetical protein
LTEHDTERRRRAALAKEHTYPARHQVNTEYGHTATAVQHKFGMHRVEQLAAMVG